MKYCNECVLPNTKPDLTFNEYDVCNACENFKKRAEINWDLRKKEFRLLLEKYQSKNNTNWDCIVPVSGGKDSSYQVWRLLQEGVNPLAVVASTCHLTDIGMKI